MSGRSSSAFAFGLERSGVHSTVRTPILDDVSREPRSSPATPAKSASSSEVTPLPYEQRLSAPLYSLRPQKPESVEAKHHQILNARYHGAPQSSRDGASSAFDTIDSNTLSLSTPGASQRRVEHVGVDAAQSSWSPTRRPSPFAPAIGDGAVSPTVSNFPGVDGGQLGSTIARDEAVPARVGPLKVDEAPPPAHYISPIRDPPLCEKRRRATVALDRNPLASAAAATPEAEPLFYPSEDWPQPRSPSAVLAQEMRGAVLRINAKNKMAVFASDFDSPSQMRETEMQSLDRLDSDATTAPTMKTTAMEDSGAATTIGNTRRSSAIASATPCVTTAPPEVVMEGIKSSAVSRPRSQDIAEGAHALLSHAVISVSATALHDSPKLAKTLRPIPYPVTSVSSLYDWSSAPRLGFSFPSDPLVAAAETQTQVTREAEERKREDKWHRLCRGVSLLASATPESIVKLRAVAKNFGIPHHLRGVMWLTLTGVALKVDENEYFCAHLLRRNGYVTGPNADAIEADVHRTFPGHPYFSERDVGIYKLTNILHAVCWRNPLLSYCQSFNFLAAFLLLVLDDEERVFWMLMYMLENLLPNDFYGETLLGANVEQSVLERLVEKRLPRVADRFRRAGLQVHALVANWMMSFFVNVFPISTTLQLWDYILCRTPNPGERTPAHLEITLATLKYLDDADMLGRSEDAGELLLALRQQTACLYDASALLRLARSFAITPLELHQLRRQFKPAAVEQMKARENARAAQQEYRLAQELQETHQHTVSPILMP